MLEIKLTYEDYIKVMMLATTNAAVKLIAQAKSLSDQDAMLLVAYEVQKMLDSVGEAQMIEAANQTLPKSYEAYYEDRG